MRAHFQPWAAIALLSLGLTFGCGPSYQDEVVEMRVQLDRHNLDGALVAVNAALGVDRSSQQPTKRGPVTGLLLLERATLLQAQGDYALSAQDFQSADAMLEVLDLGNSTAADIAEFLFSDALANYQTPPHEKVMLNTLNQLNYLAMGDLEGARVEARRLAVLQRYFDGEGPAILGLGAFLSGFTFERSGRIDEAVNWYATAVESGDFPQAGRALAYLASARPTDERAAAYAAQFPNATAPTDDQGEVLVVVASGRVPYYVAKRVPIGLAVIAAGAHMHQNDIDTANRLAVEGLFKWVNYPELQGLYGQPAASVTVQVDRQNIETTLVHDVEAEMVSYYQANEGRLAAAAITRFLTRTIAAQATEAAITRGESGGEAVAGFLIGKAVEGILIAADMPDTRSWNSLSAYYTVARAPVAAGQHTVRVNVDGIASTHEVDVYPGGFATVVVVRP